MKKNIRLVLIGVVLGFFMPTFPTGCTTAPTQRSTEVTTLKVLGASVDGAMKLAAQLLANGKITWAQWNTLAAFHDNKFQPAYNLAVSAVQADLSTIASPDLVSLAGQLAAIVASYQPKNTTP